MIFALNSEIPDDSQTNATRAYLGARFSAMISVMLMGSLYVALILSKTIDRASENGLLSELPFDVTSKSTHITAGATMSSLMIPLIWLSFIDDPQVYEDGAFLGPFWGCFRSNCTDCRDVQVREVERLGGNNIPQLDNLPSED